MGTFNGRYLVQSDYYEGVKVGRKTIPDLGCANEVGSTTLFRRTRLQTKSMVVKQTAKTQEFGRQI